jgi:hypothetical protein
MKKSEKATVSVAERMLSEKAAHLAAEIERSTWLGSLPVLSI